MKFYKYIPLFAVCMLIFSVLTVDINAQRMSPIPETVLPEKTIDEIINEISGSLPFNHMIELGGYNRDRLRAEYYGTYWESEYIEKMAKLYGFSNVHIETFEAGMFGRGGQWDAELGELWITEPEEKLIISHRDEPCCLASGSKTCDVTAELVFVGDGTKETDYEGIDVAGKIVLATGAGGSWGGAMGRVYNLAVNKNGAYGAVVFKSARPFEYPDQIPWASIRGEVKDGTFGFNLTHRLGYELMERLIRGEKIKVRAKVKTERHNTDSEVVTAVIPGKTDEELVYCAHLFEGVTKQGACDNHSGCAVILEAGRTIIKLMEKGILPQPERTIRFLWIPEISGTFQYLQKYPEEVKKMIGAINLDMVGEDLHRMSNSLNLELPKYSLFGYLGDITREFFEYVRDTNRERWGVTRNGYLKPIIDVRGTQTPFFCYFEAYGGASDHMVFMSPLYKIPSLCYNNWPDHVYHTNQDRPEFADPTQLKRVAFIAAASGITIAYGTYKEVPVIGNMMLKKSQKRIAEDVGKYNEMVLKSETNNVHINYKEAAIGIEEAYKREKNSLETLKLFAKGNETSNNFITGIQESLDLGLEGHLKQLEINYEMTCKIKNTKKEKIKLTKEEKDASSMVPKLTLSEDSVTKLFRLQGKLPRNIGDEALGFTNGKRNLLEIRNAVSAEYYPVKIEDVIEHFKMLEENKVVRFK